MRKSKSVVVLKKSIILSPRKKERKRGTRYEGGRSPLKLYSIYEELSRVYFVNIAQRDEFRTGYQKKECHFVEIDEEKPALFWGNAVFLRKKIIPCREAGDEKDTVGFANADFPDFSGVGKGSVPL